MNYFNMTTKTYTYSPKNEPNVSFAGTTENFIYISTPTCTGVVPRYVGMIPVYETPVAGSLDNTAHDSSAPGSLKVKGDK